MQILVGGETNRAPGNIFVHSLLIPAYTLSTLQAEIDIAVNTNGKISSPVIRDKEWHRLPYLQAIIKEGLRIWPPVTGTMSKFSPPNGDEFHVNGKRVSILGGTNIRWASWGIHWSKAVFGEDAVFYKPERMLDEGNQEKLERMRKVVDLNFGYGKYYCLGRQVVLLELHKMIFEVRDKSRSSIGYFEENRADVSHLKSEFRRHSQRTRLVVVQ